MLEATFTERIGKNLFVKVNNNSKATDIKISIKIIDIEWFNKFTLFSSTTFLFYQGILINNI